MISVLHNGESDAPVLDITWPACCGEPMTLRSRSVSREIFACPLCRSKETRQRGALRIVVRPVDSRLRQTLGAIAGAGR